MKNAVLVLMALGLVVQVSFGAFAQASMLGMDDMQMPAKTRIVTTHGLFAFGEETLYLSHLPMFHAPHNEQVIFEAIMDEKGMDAYARAKKVGELVTIVPEPFDLDEMIAHPTSFKAALYQGHFERGGAKLASKIEVTILKVVHAHKLPADPEPDILFGGNYRAHFITKAPDFDEIEQLDPVTRMPTTIYREEDDLVD